MGIKTMKMIRLVFVGIVVSLLDGCASLPDNTYTTTEGCGITQWRKEWVQNNVESMSWMGPCKNGLAQGSGTLVLKRKNGKQVHYVGWMYGGDIYGDGTYTSETGWKYVGNFQNAKLKQGRVYIASGRLLFEGSMANDVQYNGKNLTYDDWRYHTGKLYYADGSYIDDARFTGSAGVYEGISSVDPQTGKGIVYGKYVKDGEVVNRYVEGRRYNDDPAYEQAKARYNENLSAIQAAAAAKKKAEDEAAYKAMVERREQRNREGLAMLGNAVTAAAGGQNVAERRQLAIQSFSQPASGAGVTAGEFSTRDIIQLDGVGAPSLFNCMKFEWVSDPTAQGREVGEHYGSGESSYAVNGADDRVRDRKMLVATNTCEEKVMYELLSCHDRTMLKSGKNSKGSWTAGELAGVQAKAHGPTIYVMGKGARVVIAESYKFMGGDGQVTAPVQVLMGVWQKDAIHLPDGSGITEAGKTIGRKEVAMWTELHRNMGNGPRSHGGDLYSVFSDPIRLREASREHGRTTNSCRTANLKHFWDNTQ